MKKLTLINVGLVIALASTAGLMLKQGQTLKVQEANLQQELAMLSKAVKHAPSAARPTQRPSLDAAAFTAGLKSVLDGDSSKEVLNDFLSLHESKLSSASAAQLREIAAWLEQNYPVASKERSLAQMTWDFVMQSLAKSDPAGTIANFERVASKIGTSPVDLLPTLKRMGGEPMRLTYAAALQKWLDTAHLDATLPLVAELRASIAAAQGNQSAAVKEIAQLPAASQRDAVVAHAKTLQGPEQSRQALEEFSTSLPYQNYQEFVRSLATHQGIDAAREAVDAAALTAEHHDLTLASIAGASIGPETKERAAWLLAALRSEDHRALADFAAQWSQGDHTAAATWANTLPKGIRRDAALHGLIPVAARIDGATAMDWALTVSDPHIRNQLYSEVHAKWSETDATQANAYRQAKPLDREALMAAGRQ